MEGSRQPRLEQGFEGIKLAAHPEALAVGRGAVDEISLHFQSALELAKGTGCGHLAGVAGAGNKLGDSVRGGVGGGTAVGEDPVMGLGDRRKSVP